MLTDESKYNENTITTKVPAQTKKTGKKQKMDGNQG